MCVVSLLPSRFPFSSSLLETEKTIAKKTADADLVCLGLRDSGWHTLPIIPRRSGGVGCFSNERTSTEQIPDWVRLSYVFSSQLTTDRIDDRLTHFAGH
jgi:hypothetical protein